MTSRLSLNRRQTLVLGAASATLPIIGTAAWAVPPAAPILSIEQPVSGLKPEFVLDLAAVALNDIILIDRSISSSFPAGASTVQTSVTVTQAVLDNGFTNLAGYSVPASGTYFFRAFHRRGTETSVASNTVSQAFTAAPSSVTWFTPTVQAANFSSNGAVTFSAVSIPNVASSRVVQVWILATGNPGIKVGSATINGVAATASSVSNYNPPAISTGFATSVFNVAMPTGTSLNAAVQFVDANNVNTAAFRSCLIVMEIQNANATPTETDQGGLSQALQVTTATSTTVPAGGVALSVAISAHSGTSPSWAGATSQSTTDLINAGIVTVAANAAAAGSPSTVQPTVTYASVTSGQLITVATNKL